MIKKIIFFDDVRLYNDCSLQAERLGMSSAEDFIVDSLEKYFVKKNPSIFIKKNPAKNVEKNNEEKSFKKPIDLWLACEQEKKEVNGEGTISDFIEAVCYQRIKELAPQAAQQPETPLMPRKVGFIKRISDAMSLPVGK